MKYLVKVGSWIFELKQVRAIKADDFHLPYSATVLITIVNGEPSIENLLSVEGFTRSDYSDIKEFLIGISFDGAEWQRFNKCGKEKGLGR